MAPMNVMCAHDWQGGGVFVGYGGEATLNESNVYLNQAKHVRLLSELSRTFFQRPYGTLRAWLCLQGGGLLIQGTLNTLKSAATLTNTNVYSNQATEARLPFEPPVTFHPLPQWSLTSLSRLAGRWRLCHTQRSG